MPARSYLFVPGDRPERYARALAAGADAVIVDLEDAVAPAAKALARRALAGWLHDGDGPPVVVRINGIDTPWFNDDLALCGAPRVAAVMLPKAEGAEALAAVAAAAPRAALLPLIESAAGIDAVRTIAAMPGVERLVFGAIDFQLDLGIEGDGDELLWFRSQLVLASRLAQRAAPVDGVATVLDDVAELAAQAGRARRLGFGAKLCIHPRQVMPVNAAFTPDAAQVAWARRVLAAAAAAGGGATALDGRMIDRPVILRAEAVLASQREHAG